MKKFLILLFLPLLLMCNQAAEEELIGAQCSTERSCPFGFECDLSRGICLCQGNEFCKSGEKCNSQGFCQIDVGCTQNLDCAESEMCDRAKKACVSKKECIFNYHCDFGKICDRDGICVDSCRVDDDCPQENFCINGECKTGYCRSNNDCGFNEACDQASQTCRNSGSQNCQSCNPQSLLGGGCAMGYQCLTFVGEGGGVSFCAQQCQQDEDCPGGFECGETFSSCQEGGIFGSLGCDPGYSCQTKQQSRTNPEQVSACINSAGEVQIVFKACSPIKRACQ